MYQTPLRANRGGVCISMNVRRGRKYAPVTLRHAGFVQRTKSKVCAV